MKWILRRKYLKTSQFQFSLFVPYYVSPGLIEIYLGLSSLAITLFCILQFEATPHSTYCTCTSHPTCYGFRTPHKCFLLLDESSLLSISVEMKVVIFFVGGFVWEH